METISLLAECIEIVFIVYHAAISWTFKAGWSQSNITWNGIAA